MIDMIGFAEALRNVYEISGKGDKSAHENAIKEMKKNFPVECEMLGLEENLVDIEIDLK